MTPTMNWRVRIYGRRCWVQGYKRGDIAFYEQEYGFWLWPWTDVESKIARLKERMTWECGIVLAESCEKSAGEK